MKTILIGLSALVGGVLAVLADLSQKGDASAIINLGYNLSKVFGLASPATVSTVLILLIAVALALIFDVSSKRQAFYVGASVLSIMMTIVPYKTPDGFKTTPNSVEVVVNLATANQKPIVEAVVSLWREDGRTLVARSQVSSDVFRFYQDGGDYKLSVEMAGYSAQFIDLKLIEGSTGQSLSVILQPSETPIFIQRLLR
jgi:hypothetical protein